MKNENNYADSDSLFSEEEMKVQKNSQTEKDSNDFEYTTDYTLPSVNSANQKFVIQPNTITKAIYDMNLGSKRIIMMASSLLLTRDKNGKVTPKKDLKVSFQIEDVVKSLKLTHGSTTKKMLDQAIDTIFDQKIRIKTEDGWTQLYHWFVSSNYSAEHNGIELTFTPEVAKAFVEYLNGYSVINLDVYGRLNGKYSIRMYELCWSYHNFANKTTGQWKTRPVSVQEIREMWQIGEEKYPMMADFKKRVFEVARSEINSYENSQFTVDAITDIKQGKKIVAFVFECRLREVKKDPIKSLAEQSLDMPSETEDPIDREQGQEMLARFKQKISEMNDDAENTNV